MRLSPARRWFAAAALTSTLALTTACGVGQQSDDTDSGSDSNASSEESSDDTAVSDATTFTAGSYEAEGTYDTPGGEQAVDVELTLEEDGTITDLVVTGQADGGNSEQYQTYFEDGIADEVVGKKITELDVSKVGGSSLTSGGFNAAIDDIIGQAEA